MQTTRQTSRPKAAQTAQGPAWYLLFVSVNHELRAASLLGRRGFPVYVPLAVEHERTLSKFRPLFSRYLFARFTEADRFRVLATPGIVEIVAFGGEPATVSDMEIERVRRLERRLRTPRPAPQRGTVISLRVGHHRLDLAGTVVGQKRGLDVIVLKKAAA